MWKLADNNHSGLFAGRLPTGEFSLVEANSAFIISYPSLRQALDAIDVLGQHHLSAVRD